MGWVVARDDGRVAGDRFADWMNPGEDDELPDDGTKVVENRRLVEEYKDD